ncbi:CoA transferase [Microbacterium sp. E-13]|uniref:CaiB/BaiF CoA-transferase family protein n=1 Tax=Microbacterium sp. E-13 TaxID=3404048 RepID=UPI003CF5CAF3
MTALAGVRVLDLSTGIAGPVATMFLADFGADVIRVDGPAPDPQATNPGYAVWHRNKRSVLVDPARHADLEWLAASVAGADVVVLGHGSDLSDWGSAVARAGRENCHLITVRLPAYLDGHSLWGGGESSLLLAAAGGQAMRQASVSGGAIASMSPHLSYIHGLWAVTCTVAALVERTVSGLGQTVTVTGVNALIEANIYSVSTSANAPDPLTTVGPAGRHPSYRHFLCGDGKWMAIGALGPKFEERLLRALGLDSVIEDERIAGVTARMALPENLPWVRDLLESAFSSRTREEMLALVEGIGIPCGPMNSREEWFDSEIVRAIGMHVSVEDPERGTVEMPGVPIVLTRTPGSVTGPAPSPGQHTGIAPWPAKPAQPDVQPRFVPGPLSGFRVLNMGTFVASPYAGLLLSELGAEVIKVEPVTGDPFRVSGYTVNRGMRSVSIDLSTAAGQAVFHRLAETADVVMDAMRPGVMKKLNIDYEALSAVNPRIVTQSLSAYGEGGAQAHRPGVDMVIQAESGMMAAWGGCDDPVGNTIAINDVATAATSALVALLGLYERQISGRGQRTWNSLAATSVFLQMEEMVRYEGRPAPAVGSADFRGVHPLRSYYEAQDGWLGVDVHMFDDDAAAGRLRAAGVIGDGPLRDELTAAIGALTVTDALRALAHAGIPSAAARKVSEVLRDPELLEAEAFHIRSADDGTTFMQSGRYAAFSRTQRRGPMSPPGNGEHTRALLTGIGLTPSEVDELIADGTVFAGGPVVHQLPISYR